MLNKEIIRIKESLNVTFDESLPEPKSSPLVEDDRIIEPIVQYPVRSPSLEVNVSEPSYPKSVKEARDSGFNRFNAVVTSLKSLDPDYFSKNHVRKFLRALPLKYRAKVTAIEEAKDLATLPLDELIGNLKSFLNGGLYFEVEDEDIKSYRNAAWNFSRITEKKHLSSLKNQDDHLQSLYPQTKVVPIEEAKDLATLPLDELIGNLKVYEMVLDNDGVDSKTTKEKVKSLALKAKVTREQTSDDSDSQGESLDEVIDLVMVEIGLEKAAVATLETKVEKARNQREHAIIAALKAISLVSVESQRRTRLLLEDHGSIVKMDDWILDSGCTKHMTRNRRLFTSYKEYDGGHVVFGSNLKGKVVGGGQLCDDDCLVSFTKKDSAINKNNKMLAKGHRRNGLFDLINAILELCEQTWIFFLTWTGPFTYQSCEIVNEHVAMLRKR
ncbi:retrovirus-related pol polyprotein from transposon TNT 1-94 [Tanacetum coccineum]